MSLPRSLIRPVCLAGIFIVSFLLYLPAANGPYLVDDYPNLLNNDALIMDSFDGKSLIEAATSSRTGLAGRPLSMLSFALNYTLAGDKDVLPVKLVNILLHLLVGAGLYLLSSRLLAFWLPPGSPDIYWIALLTTTLWLIHPLQISTVLYAVQRMTILSALFTIGGLLAYIKYRSETLAANTAYLKLLCAVTALTLLGILAKENAILLPVFALLIELCCFRLAFHPDTKPVKRLAVIGMLTVPLLAIGTYLIYSYFRYSGADLWPHQFSIEQRLLSQPRMLMHYLGWTALVNPEALSLHHDDIVVSTGLFTPVTTALSIAGLLLLIAAAAYSLVRRRYTVIGFGLAWFLVGHLVESGPIPLEMLYEHRNYLPMAGLLLIPAWLLVRLPGQLPGHTDRRIYFCAVIVLLAGLLAHERVGVWRDEKSMVAWQLKQQPELAWTWSDAANLLSRAGQPAFAIGSMRKAAQIAPSEPAYIFGEAYIRCLHAPQQEFPGEFSSVLIKALDERIVSTTSINAFVNMINQCQQSRNNDAVLRQIYQAAAAHPMALLADVGRRALELMERHRREGSVQLQ